MGKIGIDFGTTNSLMVAYDKITGKFTYFNFKEGNPTPMSSTIWYHDNQVIVGNQARKEMFRLADNESHHFEKSIKLKLGQSTNIDIFGKKYQPYEIAATIIKSLKEKAIQRMATEAGIDLNDAVFTVPINFSGKQRRDLRKSAHEAGIEVNTFIHEPFAAIVGYYFSRADTSYESVINSLQNLNNHYILTFDWGGGTLDITVVQIKNGKMYELGTSELTNMAGDKIDEEIAWAMWNRYIDEYGHKYTEAYLEKIRKTKWGRMISIAEQCKIDLSKENEVEFEIAINGEEDIYEILTPNDLENIISNILDSALNKIDDALREANISHNNISHVLLTGGTCYIPAVQKKMKEKFGHRVETVQNADLLIAQGAAVIGELGWMPFLTKDILIQLADNSYWPIFEKGMPISSKEEAHRSENFLTTDSSNKIAKVLVYEGMNQRTDKMLTVLNIPIPGRRSYGDEIVIEAIIDKDIILKIRGYSYVAIYPGMSRNEATSIRINKEVYQLCFGLDFMR